MNYKVYFGSLTSIGVEVEAISEREAKIKAMTVLKENRGDRSWDPRFYVDWEERAGKVVYTVHPETQEAILVNSSGETVYAGPPASRDFGAFPPIVKVKKL